MIRVVNPISKKTPNGRSYNVFAAIKYDEAKKTLSITGVEGPLKGGNALGGCGQIDTVLREEDRSEWLYRADWDGPMMDKLLDVWGRWHLNNMRAGTPAQEAFIRQSCKHYDYAKVCEALKAAGLYEDHGYTYGTAWLKEELPADVVEWLFSLPETKVTPAWI